MNVVHPGTFEVDAVLTWVRIDEELRASMRTRLGRDDNRGGAREFSEELDTAAYIVRSIRRFAPWIRKIFVVTNGQFPDFMSSGEPTGVELITHEEIFPRPPELYLPTFNSYAIEMNLHRIPGLADRFLYFNDDMFLCRSTVIGDFYGLDGNPVLATSDMWRPAIEKLAQYEGPRNVVGGVHYLSCVWYMRDLVRRTLGTEPDIPWHGVNAFKKEYFVTAERLFPDGFESTRCIYYWSDDVDGTMFSQYMPLLVAQATGAIARAENRPLLYTTKTPSSLDLFQTLFASNDSPVLCMQN